MEITTQRFIEYVRLNIANDFWVRYNLRKYQTIYFRHNHWKYKRNWKPILRVSLNVKFKISRYGLHSSRFIIQGSYKFRVWYNKMEWGEYLTYIKNLA